jgi:hypothetical protein
MSRAQQTIANTRIAHSNLPVHTSKIIAVRKGSR